MAPINSPFLFKWWQMKEIHTLDLWIGHHVQDGKQHGVGRRVSASEMKIQKICNKLIIIKR